MINRSEIITGLNQIKQLIKDSLLECFEIEGNKCVLFVSNTSHFQRIVRLYFDNISEDYEINNFKLHKTLDFLDIRFENGSRFQICNIYRNSRGARWNKIICDDCINDDLIEVVALRLYTPYRKGKKFISIYDTPNYLSLIKIP